MQNCLRWKALLVNLCVSHVLYISTAKHCLVDAWVSPSYPSHHRLTNLLGRHPLLADALSVESSSSTDQTVLEKKPILRTLYDAPPQLNDNTTSADSHGNTTNTDSEYITEITTGTLSTESSHELYYQVHHRFLNNNTNEVPSSSSTNSNSNSTYKKDSSSKGLTALFLHGGPGAGCYPNHVRFFSPQLYETVILLDQRGCGRSTPLGEVANNTLELIVNDVERLRIHLLGENQPFDVILGGSWGCTCAMAYAHTYPRHVRAMVLRGVCLFRPQEIDWLFGDPQPQKNDESIVRSTSNLRALLGGGNNDASKIAFRRGSDSSAVLQIQEPSTITQTKEEQTATVYQNTASNTFPKGWKEFCKGSNIAKVQTGLQDETQKSGRSILHRYYNLLLGKDPTIRFNAVKSWLRWEMGIYSSGFNSENGNKNDSNAVWVWNPSTELWAHEDARVMNNESFTSVEVNPNNIEVEKKTVQLLRRFSSATKLDEETVLESTKIEPIPVSPVIASTSQQSIATSSKTKNNSSNSTFDPTTYIPAQSMLTCYYSANDNYCIGPYRSFLSLSNEPYWYTSKLPPQTTLQQGAISTSTSIESSFSLPPTIAIQGGNDAICPPDTALDLHEVWKELELRICAESGHSMYDPVICGEIVKALDRFGHSLSVD